MKSIRVMIAALVVLTASVFAAPNSQQTFHELKSLAGNWEWKALDGKTVDVSFKVIAGMGTVVKIQHTGFDGDVTDVTNHGNGWTRVLGWLQGLVERGETSESRA